MPSGYLLKIDYIWMMNSHQLLQLSVRNIATDDSFKHFALTLVVIQEGILTMWK